MDLRKVLAEVCESDRVNEPGIDLVEEGLLDSMGVIELFSALEDEGIEIPLTRVDKNLLHTVEGIEKMIEMFS